MSKFIPASELTTSPITPKGEIVFSTAGSATQEQDGKLVIIDGSWQIDIPEVLAMLRWLDEQGSLLRATPSLERASNDMRAALMDIWAGIGKEQTK